MSPVFRISQILLSQKAPAQLEPGNNLDAPQLKNGLRKYGPYIQWSTTQKKKKNNDIMKFVGKWMELENIILNEVKLMIFVPFNLLSLFQKVSLSKLLMVPEDTECAKNMIGTWHKKQRVYFILPRRRNSQSSNTRRKSPPPGPRSSQSPSEEESFPKTQEQQVTLGRRGPKINQLPFEEEDPGAASHPQRTSPSHFLRPRSSQSPSEEEDPGAASHPRRKRTKEQPVTLRGRGPRSTQTPS
ncbi:hypothetical protein STEG23_016965 [Scotinomys teguina]